MVSLHRLCIRIHWNRYCVLYGHNNSDVFIFAFVVVVARTILQKQRRILFWMMRIEWNVVIASPVTNKIADRDDIFEWNLFCCCWFWLCSFVQVTVIILFRRYWSYTFMGMNANDTRTLLRTQTSIAYLSNSLYYNIINYLLVIKIQM